MLWLIAPALAGDLPLYSRALAYVDGFYLHPEKVSREEMFEDAGRQAERAIDWLLVDVEGPTLRLRDGAGTWQSEVRLDRPQALPDALSRLEDALRAGPHPLPDGVDLRVELLRGMARSLDRHSVILADSALARFDERLSGTMSGVGLSCGVDAGVLVVTEVYASSPAERGGVLRGDRLLAIDGKSTVGMVVGDLGGRLRGPVGSTVTLQIARGTGSPSEWERIERTLQRAEVQIPNVFVDRDSGDVGVVRIDHFSEQTHEWLERSLETIRQSPVGALVLDLRGNTGGSLLQSADAADAFLQHGRIVSTVGPDGHAVPGLTETFDAGPDSPPEALPIAVLVDHQTASGSEILSGALQHLDRALVFGTNSFGKGTVQKVYPLTEGIKFKLTVAEYRLADDARVMDVGIHPDVLFYPYRFDGDGVWFPNPTQELKHAPPGTVLLPLPTEYPGWRSGAPPMHDAPLDTAVSLIAAAEGASRAKLLSGLELIAPSLEANFDARLEEVFGARGMDWSPRPQTEAMASSPMDASGTLLVEAGPDGVDSAADTVTVTAGAAVTLRVSVRNDGPSLWRARVRLHSVNGVWDDRVLPLGKFASASSRTGETRLTVPLSASSRADVVELWLEADGFDARPIGQRVIAVAAEPPVELGATLRAKTDRNGRMTVDVAVADVTAREPGVVPRSYPLRVRFAWSDLPGVEWLAPSQVAVELPARGTVHVGLALQLGAEAPPQLPLTLVIESPTGATLARWPVALDRDAVTHVQPPTLSLRTLSKVQPPGIALLQMRASDDERIDHVMVYAGTERVDRSRYEPETLWDAQKVSWSDGSEPDRRRDERRVEDTVAVPVHLGENRYEVSATDATGLRTTRVVYILGQPPDAPSEAESQ
jgi:C-terminal peptidase prc